MNIYVVIGSTGEYSDRSEWMVAAYESQDVAQQHVTLASEQARAALAEAEASDDGWEVRDSFSNPYDPGSRMDYTGTTYYVAAVPLLAEIPDARRKGETA